MNQEQRLKQTKKTVDHHWLGVVVDIIRHLILRVYVDVENKLFEQFWYTVYSSDNDIIF